MSKYEYAMLQIATATMMRSFAKSGKEIRDSESMAVLAATAAMNAIEDYTKQLEEPPEQLDLFDAT